MFHEKIKDLRKQKGVTGEFVANATGLSESAYRNYERGVREPNFETLSKLADFYGVTTDYLLGREPAPQPDPQLYQETLLKLLELNKADKIPFVDKYNALPKLQREALDFIAQCLLKEQDSEASRELVPNIIEDVAAGEYRKRLGLDEEVEAKGGGT